MKMIPILEAVNTPMFTQYIHEGKFIAKRHHPEIGRPPAERACKMGASLKDLGEKGSI